MATHIPGTGAVDAAGGYAVLEGEESGILIAPVLEASGALQFFGVKQTSTRSEKYTMLADVDEPDFFDEPVGDGTGGALNAGSRIKVGGFELGVQTAHVADLGEIIAFGNDLISDAKEDPTALIDDAVIRRFARVFDRNLVSASTKFDDSLLKTVTQVVYMDPTRPDRLDYAVSQAMGMVEDAGGTPRNFLGCTDLKREVREAGRESDKADRIYQTAGRDPFHGLNPSFSVALKRLNATNPNAEDVVGAVCDPAFSRVVLRQDVEVSKSDAAAVTIGGELVSLWEHNMTGIRWIMRAGAKILVPNTVVLIKRGPEAP